MEEMNAGINNHAEEYRQIGLNIAHHRKLRRLTQEQLAEKANISRVFLSHIEAPNMATSFSIATLFDIAEVLEVDIRDFFEFK